MNQLTHGNIVGWVAAFWQPNIKPIHAGFVGLAIASPTHIEIVLNGKVSVSITAYVGVRYEPQHLPNPQATRKAE
jgi:hypothetical protein